jgi:hypothetical protein
MSDKIIKKLSVKGVCGKPVPPANGESKDLMNVIGNCQRTKVVTTTFGESVGLQGLFKAINLETGEAFRAGTAYLPDVALDLILGEMAKKDVESVDFAFTIGIVGDSELPTKYFYIAKPLLEASESDPIAAIEARMTKQPAPALENKGKNGTTKVEK